MTTAPTATVQGQATRAVHGTTLKDAHGAPHMPIYNTTTFAFENTAALLDVVDGRTPGALYTRYGMNPSVFALEQTLASIETAEACWAFCSGMAAEMAVFAEYGRDGIVCIGDAYGGTLELLASQLPLLGINTTFILGSELEKLDGFLAGGARLVFFETPTNPTLEILDIRAIAATAQAHGALVAVDNTFASPVNQRPLEVGADLVIYSATKYLGGHSDITAGVVLGRSELITPLWSWRKNLGTTITPETASLLARSLRTLLVRVTHQNKSAQAVAEAMEAHPRISRVLYPGLPSHPGHDLAKELMQGFGGILTIEIGGDAAAASAVADKLKIFALAPSLGGAESLATQPSTTTHHGLTVQERLHRGISDSMIRLSIGLEDPADLIDDLTQALG
ncbi:aminotransferase class I/II-fold pyridoxal phosphate-dependent enzyme [Pseudarthrobacter equi]|uniref:trans-sulfuration enzyme family protein n=1 Tax=Pseudarthrobacter equi TaxID=728066 RepID=UPI0021BF6BE1|nr:aminotransferase class I/II-fold pyridoxal phosphate-dependent enzyme [Pseudarthrobacter equi]MCT9626726.1 aminotransferase class I/II-fold pyridoxal phosphate-dependent enzyme [Pseudarthrobacter equi]